MRRYGKRFFTLRRKGTMFPRAVRPKVEPPLFWAERMFRDDDDWTFDTAY